MNDRWQTTVRCVILVLLCSAANPWAAAAADIFLDGEATCLSIGGAWSAATCTVDRLIVPADTRLFTVREVGLTTGELVIDGLLQIDGGFEATRMLLNRGTLITRSLVVSQAKMWNRGTWLNQGAFYSDNSVVNDWILDNRGIVQTRSGVFANRGYAVIGPGAQIWSSGGLMVNEGNLYNYGYLYNPTGALLDNAGVIATYDATFFNYGRTRGRCGSAYLADMFGSPVGNPVEFEPCAAADAAGALSNYVLGLGRRGVLSKDDAILFSQLLIEAGTRLRMGDTASGDELMRMFIADVSSRIAFPIRELLLARAARVLELVMQL
jgi:hypothetical protein